MSNASFPTAVQRFSDSPILVAEPCPWSVKGRIRQARLAIATNDSTLDPRGILQRVPSGRPNRGARCSSAANHSVKSRPSSMSRQQAVCSEEVFLFVMHLIGKFGEPFDVAGRER